MYDDPNKPGDYHGPKVYSGVRGDIKAMEGLVFNDHMPLVAVVFLVDLPLSFVADTLLLPLTVYEDHSRTGEQKNEESKVTRDPNIKPE